MLAFVYACVRVCVGCVCECGCGFGWVLVQCVRACRCLVHKLLASCISVLGKFLRRNLHRGKAEAALGAYSGKLQTINSVNMCLLLCCMHDSNAAYFVFLRVLSLVLFCVCVCVCVCACVCEPRALLLFPTKLLTVGTTTLTKLPPLHTRLHVYKVSAIPLLPY